MRGTTRQNEKKLIYAQKFHSVFSLKYNIKLIKFKKKNIHNKFYKKAGFYLALKI